MEQPFTNRLAIEQGSASISEPLIDTKTAARILGIPEGLLRKYRSAKVGPPYFKIEGNVRYSKDSLSNYLAGVERR